MKQYVYPRICELPKTRIWVYIVLLVFLTVEEQSKGSSLSLSPKWQPSYASRRARLRAGSQRSQNRRLPPTVFVHERVASHTPSGSISGFVHRGSVEDKEEKSLHVDKPSTITQEVPSANATTTQRNVPVKRPDGHRDSDSYHSVVSSTPHTDTEPPFEDEQEHSSNDQAIRSQSAHFNPTSRYEIDTKGVGLLREEAYREIRSQSAYFAPHANHEKDSRGVCLYAEDTTSTECVDTKLAHNRDDRPNHDIRSQSAYFAPHANHEKHSRGVGVYSEDIAVIGRIDAELAHRRDDLRNHDIRSQSAYFPSSHMSREGSHRHSSTISSMIGVNDHEPRHSNSTSMQLEITIDQAKFDADGHCETTEPKLVAITRKQRHRRKLPLSRRPSVIHEERTSTSVHAHAVQLHEQQRGYQVLNLSPLSRDSNVDMASNSNRFRQNDQSLENIEHVTDESSTESTARLSVSSGKSDHPRSFDLRVSDTGSFAHPQTPTSR